jgi:ABC-2 type transport system ATP-binding protein
MIMSEVVVKNIRKTYNKEAVVAVNDISFEVKKAELFGLIGPDGAGKTSVFRMLTTLLLPDSGAASVSGLDIVKDFKKIRSQVGYMPGKFSLYQDLTVEENLIFFATIFNTNVEENYDLIKDIYIQIEPFKNRRAGQLSGGMKQKLALCCALIHKPTVLFLDEPTTGVDTVSRKEFWEMLKKLKDQGITILVSTPYMDEATMCERIALMQQGKIMSIDTPQNIINTYPKKMYAIKARKMSSLLKELNSNPLMESANSFGEFHHITFKNGDLSDNLELLNTLKNAQYDDVEFKEIQPTIEDCFIHLMQHNHDR